MNSYKALYFDKLQSQVPLTFHFLFKTVQPLTLLFVIIQETEQQLKSMADKIRSEERKHQQISPEDDDERNIIGVYSSIGFFDDEELFYFFFNCRYC